MSENARPHDIYTREFFGSIVAAGPRTLLDVGCGDGALMEAATSQGIRCAGIEVEEESVADLAARGLDVRHAPGEALPFPDRSFDAVVLQYVPHHLADLPRALLEAARVARKSVHLLDAWYDEGFASQRVGLAYDLWLKTLDRRGGMVHNPLSAPATLAAPFLGLGFGVEFGCRLILDPLDPSELESKGQAKLAEGHGDAELQSRLSAIMDEARIHGVTDAGAVMLTAARP
jgi:SAM-dependent methyltransferase